MEKLQRNLLEMAKKADVDKKTIMKIQSEESVAPFTTVNRLMAYLLAIGELKYADYEKISADYIRQQKSKNQYIDLFDMSPRTFGQIWGENYIHKMFPQLKKATKELLVRDYPDFDGEFDLWFRGIRIEVKACRANSTKTKGPLSERAYSHLEAKQAGFKYHYQQLKPSCCDVFIWIGVCRDELIYWVLSSADLVRTGKLGSQHRNENTGVTGAGVFEGQVFYDGRRAETISG